VVRAAWLRKLHASGGRGWRHFCVLLPAEALWRLGTPYVKLEERGEELVVRPAPAEEVVAAAREVGKRALWTRGIYRVQVYRVGGRSAARVTVPTRVAERWGTKYVHIEVEEDGSVVIRPARVDEEVARTIIATYDVWEALRRWARRAE
jgi:hypothetical protein